MFSYIFLAFFDYSAGGEEKSHRTCHFERNCHFERRQAFRQEVRNL